MESSTSNRTGNERKRKIDEIHEDLKYDLAFNHLESSKKFRGAASKYLSHADRSEFKEPSDIMERLEATGKLAPGQYGVLRQIGERIQESAFVAAIDEAERKIVKTEVNEDDNQLFHPSNEKINNIIAQTKREIDQHICDKSYVRLPMVDHGLKILQQYGLLFLVGPSGCGKTKCALQILSEAKQVRVLKLQNLHEWSEMVEVAVANWVWYDDVFEHECVAKNRSKIATIKACVQDGYSKVIFTITDKIFKQNEGSFQNKIPTAAIINFEESPYTLCVEMKDKILMSHLRVNDVTIKAMKRPSFIVNDTEDKKEIYESDIQEIILKKPLLGFPQACKVFCNHLPFLRKGHYFFDNPSMELLNAMTALSSTDTYQFLTLVYTFKNNGTLDLKNIDEFKVTDLLQTFSANIPRDIEACIRVAIDNMKGKYLIPMPMNVFHFSHSSIYKAVAISYARLSNRTKIDAILSLNTANINELVKPSGYDEIDFCVIEVGRELHEELADIMSQKLKDPDHSLFKCELFALEDFIDIFLPKYQISEDQVDEHLIHFFKNGRIGLAKKLLDAKCLTIDGLEDRTFSKMLKESSVHNQLHVVKFLVKEKTSCPQKTNAIIECMDYSSQTDAVSAILVQSLAYAALNQEQLIAVSRVLARDECSKNFEFFINNLPDANNDQAIEEIGTTIGRRNARKCLDVVLNKFRSKKEEIALHIIEGACTGGHNDFITWGTEYYPELMKTNAARLLNLVEIPTTLEILLESYSNCLSAQNYSDALYELCTKGKSLCAKVLIDRWSDSSDSDIENALRAAILGEHFGTVNVISESFSIPHDMITEIRGSIRGREDMRSHSAYPNTSTPRPPSVLSRENYTPCRYEETQKRNNNRKLCVMRCLSKQYLSKERNIYSRAYRLSSLIHDNDMPHEYKLQQCQVLLAETPNIYEDLIIEPAVYSCCTEEFLFMFLMKYPNIWKQIFSSCRSDTKLLQCLILNLQKIFKKIGQEFLPVVFDFLVQTNDDIPAFMTALTATGCIFDIEEFILALESVMELHKEIAEMLLQNIEELTLHNTTIVPLKLACKRNQISVFKFIWMHTENKNDIISDFLSKDIVDQNCEVIEIMLSDLTIANGISQIFARCLHHRSSRWLSTFSRTHHQILLDSIDQIVSTVNQNGDTLSLDLMTKVLKLGRRDLIGILILACEKGWQIIIKEMLRMDINILGRTIVRSIKTLRKYGHHDMLVCFIEVLENRRLTSIQNKTILDTIMKCRDSNSDVTGPLQRLVLIPYYAPYVFSHKVISAIGIDFFIRSLSVFLSNISTFSAQELCCVFGNLVSSLTVHQENQIIEIILESSLTDICFEILAAFLPNCRNVKPELGRLLIDKVFPEEGNHVATHSIPILLYILENCSSLMQNEILLKCMSAVIRNNSIDIEVKTSAFELTRKREIDISYSIRQYFHEQCQEKRHYKWQWNEKQFFQHLIDADYLDMNQRTEGIKLCLLGDKVYNQTLARMILRKDKTSLPIDKNDLFKKICKCNDDDVNLVEYVLELYSDDIDDLSLEVGISNLIKSNIYGYMHSKVIVDTSVGRRVNITFDVMTLFYEICGSYGSDSSLKLLKYILERYTDVIEEDVIEGFNNAIIQRRYSIALEICKAFPERISISEYILHLFLLISQSDKGTELLIEISTILHIDREMCIKFAKQEIPMNERCTAVYSMFGSSITADMKWKLLCLWLGQNNILPYWLWKAGIELTHEQVTYLKESYSAFDVNYVLKICEVR